jgi:hypothetical protein
VHKTQQEMLSRSSAAVASRRQGWANSSSMCVSSINSFERLTALFVQYHRTIPFDALLGGAEDVLADLGVRQALRAMPKDARL